MNQKYHEFYRGEIYYADMSNIFAGGTAGMQPVLILLTDQGLYMQEGQFVGSRPPYGYLKDPKDCHKLVVNPDTAPVVRQIFEWAAEGTAVNKITKRLAGSGVLTPGKYAESVGLLSHPHLVGSGRWDSRMVERILANEVYTGRMIQGKSKVVGHIQTPVSQEEWVAVDSTHEPLISRETFELAQVARKCNADKFTRRTKSPYSPNILKGRIFCGHCGKNMHRQRNVNFYFFHCITNDRLGKGTCPSKVTSLHEDVLFHAITRIICKKAQVVIGKNLLLQTRVCFKTIRVTKGGNRQGRQQHKNRELSSHIWWQNGGCF